MYVYDLNLKIPHFKFNKIFSAPSRTLKVARPAVINTSKTIKQCKKNKYFSSHSNVLYVMSYAIKDQESKKIYILDFNSPTPSASTEEIMASIFIQLLKTKCSYMYFRIIQMIFKEIVIQVATVYKPYLIFSQTGM